MDSTRGVWFVCGLWLMLFALAACGTPSSGSVASPETSPPRASVASSETSLPRASVASPAPTTSPTPLLSSLEISGVARKPLADCHKGRGFRGKELCFTPDGEPASTTVRLYTDAYQLIDKQQTGPDGRFRFKVTPYLHYLLVVESPGDSRIGWLHEVDAFQPLAEELTVLAPLELSSPQFPRNYPVLTATIEEAELGSIPAVRMLWGYESLVLIEPVNVAVRIEPPAGEAFTMTTTLDTWVKLDRYGCDPPAGAPYEPCDDYKMLELRTESVATFPMVITQAGRYTVTLALDRSNLRPTQRSFVAESLGFDALVLSNPGPYEFGGLRRTCGSISQYDCNNASYYAYDLATGEYVTLEVVMFDTQTAAEASDFWRDFRHMYCGLEECQSGQERGQWVYRFSVPEEEWSNVSWRSGQYLISVRNENGVDPAIERGLVHAFLEQYPSDLEAP